MIFVEVVQCVKVKVKKSFQSKQTWYLLKEMDAESLRRFILQSMQGEEQHQQQQNIAKLITTTM